MNVCRWLGCSQAGKAAGFEPAILGSSPSTPDFKAAKYQSTNLQSMLGKVLYQWRMIMRFAQWDLLPRIEAYVFDTVKVIRLKYDQYHVVDKVILRQLIRSVTSIGANVTEASVSMSVKECVRILCIALREAQETKYRLQLLHHLCPHDGRDNRESQVSELIKIIQTIVTKTKMKLP